jgi:hypothetical protein
MDDIRKTGMAKLATAIIDPEFYVNMKADKSLHEKWAVTPLHEMNTNYAAVDAYVSYELWRRLLLYRLGVRHLQAVRQPKYCPRCEGSSSGAGKRGRDGGDGSGWNDDGGREIAVPGGWNRQISAGTGGARLQISAGTGGWNAGRQTASSAGGRNDGRAPARITGWSGAVWHENARSHSPPLLGWNDNGGRQTPVSGSLDDGGHQQTGGWNDDDGGRQTIVPTGWEVVDPPYSNDGAGTARRWGKDASGWGN